MKIKHGATVRSSYVYKPSKRQWERQSPKYDKNKTVYTPDMNFPFQKEFSPKRKKAKISEKQKSPKKEPKMVKGSKIVINADTTAESVRSEIKKMKSKNITFVIRKNKFPQKRKKPAYSETKEYRLVRTYLKVLDKNGTVRRVQVALDTQSNVSYAKPHLGTPRPWKTHENPYVKGVGGLVKGGRPTT